MEDQPKARGGTDVSFERLSGPAIPELATKKKTPGEFKFEDDPIVSKVMTTDKTLDDMLLAGQHYLKEKALEIGDIIQKQTDEMEAIIQKQREEENRLLERADIEARKVGGNNGRGILRMLAVSRRPRTRNVSSACLVKGNGLFASVNGLKHGQATPNTRLGESGGESGTGTSPKTINSCMRFRTYFNCL